MSDYLTADEVKELQELQQMVTDQMIDRWADKGAAILRTAHEQLTKLYGDPQVARVVMTLAAFVGEGDSSQAIQFHLRSVLKEAAA